MNTSQQPLSISKDGFTVTGTKTLVMGILNVTPDSFSDGNAFFHFKDAVSRGLQMEDEGADIIDIGGESSRPFSEPVADTEELRRVIPVIEQLMKRLTIPLSIDTWKASVAREALQAGALIVNDISALHGDPHMIEVLRQSSATVVLMHMQGTPKTMQENPAYHQVTCDIVSWLAERIAFCGKAGIGGKRIIIDPGIGFGKTLSDNLKLLKQIDFFATLEKPILVGASRKSFIGTLLPAPVQDRLEGSIAAAVIAAVKGASIVRVHDVQATVRALKVADAIIRA